jgi:hypothetical protein
MYQYLRKRQRGCSDEVQRFCQAELTNVDIQHSSAGFTLPLPARILSSPLAFSVVGFSFRLYIYGL